MPPAEAAATPPPRPEPTQAARPAPPRSATRPARKANRLGTALRPFLHVRLPRRYWPVLLLLPALAFGFGIGRWNSPSSATRQQVALALPPSAREEASPPVEAQPSPDAAAYLAANLTTTTEPAPPEAAPAHYAVGPEMYLDYPGQPVLLLLGDGTSQRVAARSTEYQLYRLLAGAAQPSGPCAKRQTGFQLIRPISRPGRRRCRRRRNNSCVTWPTSCGRFREPVFK
ncbi:hypothetical protein MUN84_02975 [Hymenobacter sp. 5516J-16]|uniref:hypothetical protein n=1 Tax=Hymenobacter sp. 5516J-16 TaxID=2932253 RepID=UPI001FD60EF8|nr:hypothetical protein [Hymenobacter sp. 5516J-16]UOQ77656.1 hypothetical protein MUN84_02975 [Hymenobacter sp. 5516J-16]